MAEIIPNRVPCGKKPEPTPTPKPEPTPVRTLCDLTGVKYFKLQSDIPGDYTKNCGLLGNEIDENFYFLRTMDIKTAYTINEEGRRILVLERIHCDRDIKVEIPEDGAYQFDLEDGYIVITFPDKHVERIGKFLVEGDNVHIVTDSSIQGDGSYGNPIGVDLAYRTGTLEPADFFADLTCEEATLDMISGIVYSHAVVTKENVSRFGALYTWDQAMKINEALEKEGRGWRVPTSEDWGKLLNWAENKEEAKDHITDKSGNFGCIAGNRLKSKEYWDADDDKKGSDDFGFCIYPVGICPENYNTREPQKYGFTGLYKVASFWTSTSAATTEAYVRTFSYGHDDVAQFTESRKKRLSIRLVRDVESDFDITEYAEILGEFVPVMLTTDGKQLWTSINIGMVSYDGYNPNEVTVPEEWKDVVTDMTAYKYYELVEDEGEYSYVEVEEEDLPSYAEPVVYEELPEATSGSDEFVAVEYTIHFDMLTEAKFYYNAWDGNRWHKRLLREGESVVLLYDDFETGCDTAATPYVTEENRNHEWRIYVNKQTGLDELIDTLEALKKEFGKEFKRIDEQISGLTEDIEAISGFVGDMHDEMESGFTSAFTAIDEAMAEIDAIEEAVGLTSAGTFETIRESGITAEAESIAEAIGLLDDAVMQNIEDIDTLSGIAEDLIVKTDEMQDELDEVENAVGLSSAGTYVMKSGTTYLDEAESVEEEIAILDEVAASAMTEIEELQKRTIEPGDDSIIVEVSGSTTYVRVQLDEDDTHIKLGENGIFFDGDFKLSDEPDDPDE